MVEYVELDGDAFSTILRGAIEVRGKETMFHLYGNKSRKRFFVENADPLQTAYRGSTRVEPENISALERLALFNEAFITPVIKKSRKVKKRVGEAHTHTANLNQRNCRLTIRDKRGDGDLAYIEDIMKDENIQDWLEIIVSIKFKDYNKIYEPDTVILSYPKKERVISKNGRVGWDIILAAYHVIQDNKRLRVNELPIILPRRYYWYYNGALNPAKDL